MLFLTYVRHRGLQVRYKEGRLLSLNTDVAKAANPHPATGLDDTGATSEALLTRILSSLDEDKAEDVVQIDLRGKTSIGDYMVICSGTSNRHVSTISDYLSQMVKQQHQQVPKIQGQDAGEWVIFDCLDVVVHIMRPEFREF